ncbi:MAG: DUF115 domain-containing protein [Thermoplasmata archaeon]|jgi:hypothetical protein|nr:DUF115 domain-containing protein [Thermoplasmata archaeon]
MKLETWLPIYERICDDFKFDRAKDVRSAQLLAEMIGDRGTRTLAGWKGRLPATVLVCGGSPSLADEVSSIEIKDMVIAADSATTVLVEAGIHPEIVVTDLDGIIEDQSELSRKGTTLFLHAHGDNVDPLRRYFGDFPGPVVGTCQCPPPPGLVNFGGFTDGDRAACICAALGARKILLAGFDFDNPSEKVGKNRDVKLRKLEWARKILDAVRAEGVTVVNASEDTAAP